MDSFSKKNRISIAIIITALMIGGFLYFFNISEVEARSGCCSWHGGVCTYKCPDGVNVGYMCCDGTSLSAKCAPYYARCPTKATPECPSYSTYNPSSDSCECNYGYIALGSECIDGDTYCHDKYGSHSSYDILSKGCECNYGYKLISGKCVEPEPVKEQLPVEEQSTEELAIEEEQSAAEQSSEQPPAPQENLPASEKFTAEIPIKEQPPAKEQSTEEPAIEEEQPAKEQSSGQPPASQRGLPVPEELTAEIPKEDSGGGSIFGWIIGLGVVAILFYVFKTRKKRKKDYERKN